MVIKVFNTMILKYTKLTKENLTKFITDYLKSNDLQLSHITDDRIIQENFSTILKDEFNLNWYVKETNEETDYWNELRLWSDKIGKTIILNSDYNLTGETIDELADFNSHFFGDYTLKDEQRAQEVSVLIVRKYLCS